MSSIDKVFNALASGEQLTTKQISSRFKVKNPRNPVYRLRQEGYPVNLVLREDTSGRKTRKYLLNTTEVAASTYTVVRV